MNHNRVLYIFTNKHADSVKNTFSGANVKICKWKSKSMSDMANAMQVYMSNFGKEYDFIAEVNSYTDSMLSALILQNKFTYIIQIDDANDYQFIRHVTAYHLSEIKIFEKFGVWGIFHGHINSNKLQSKKCSQNVLDDLDKSSAQFLHEIANVQAVWNSREGVFQKIFDTYTHKGGE